MPPNRLLLNTLLVGLLGHGKTSTIKLILRQLLAYCFDIRVLLFDPNRSYEGAPFDDPRTFVSLDWRDTRINALRAPVGYAYASWLNESTDTLSRGELLHSRYFLAKRIEELYYRAGVPPRDDGVSPIPSLWDLRDDLQRRPCKPGSAEERYRQTSLSVLDGLRATERAFDCGRGMEDRLVDTHARISTAGLAPLENLRFFQTQMINYSYRTRLTAPIEVPPNLFGVIVNEEAQSLVERDADAPLALMHEILLRGRAVGIGQILACQSLSRIDPTVLSGIGNFFVFGQSSADSKRAAQRILDLSDRETALLGELPVGECFCKFVGHPWPWPFLLKVKP
jgi:hypothetical protein